LTSQAQIIRNSIETNWGLGGTLSKTETDSMKEVVRFFDRKQVKGNEWPKAVTVEKINAEGEENIVEHPRYSEVSDQYYITLHYRVTNVEPETYSTALDQVEKMATEVQRIIALTYSPADEQGTFFTTTSYWTKQDHLEGAQPELIRRWSFQLTKIISTEETVFTGFGGVLTFDLSASSNMDNPPSSDYVYAESNAVRINEGFETIPYLTKDKVNGAGVPALKRGIFRGKFVASVFAKKADFNSLAEKLNRIYLMQSNGQHIEAVFLHANNSLEATPSTLTSQSFVKVVSMEKITDNEILVSFDITGDLFKPSVYTVAP